MRSARRPSVKETGPLVLFSKGTRPMVVAPEWTEVKTEGMVAWGRRVADGERWRRRACTA